MLYRIEKIIQENAFEQKNKKPRFKFDPGLALIGLQTTGPRTITLFSKFLKHDNYAYKLETPKRQFQSNRF